MTPATILPDKITKAYLTNKTKLLREIALSDHAFALPFTQQGKGQTGIICSLDSCRSLMEQEGKTFSDVLTLKALEERVSSYSEQTQSPEDQFLLITIGEKPGAQAAGFVFYHGPRCDHIAQHVERYTSRNGYVRSPHPIATASNMDHPEVIRVLSRELRGGLKHVQDAIDNNLLIAPKNGHFAGLSREWALKLRACMFPNNPHILTDATASDVNQRFGLLKDDIEGGQAFARVVKRDRWNNISERDLVLVPGYAVEFLDLDPGTGEIKGTKDTNTLSMRFNMDYQIDSDFLHRTRFRLNSPDIGKFNLVEKAMETLRTSSGILALQSITRSLHEHGRERRLSGTQGHLKFSGSLGVSFTLHADGKVDDLAIGNGKPNRLCKAALAAPQEISMIYRGRDYSLENL